MAAVGPSAGTRRRAVSWSIRRTGTTRDNNNSFDELLAEGKSAMFLSENVADQLVTNTLLSTAHLSAPLLKNTMCEKGNGINPQSPSLAGMP